MPEEHAFLSASGAHRWINCTPSAALEKQFPDTAGSYAAEGTLAHSLAELKLRKQFEIMKPSAYKQRLAEIQSDELYQREMDGYTDTYVDYIRSLCMAFAGTPYVVVEKRLDFSQIVPGGFGTGDCVILYDDTLHIVDLKYGKGVAVSAENNPQLRLYALGAVQEYSLLYTIRQVQMHIVQPRLDNISTDSLTADELQQWGERVKPLAEQAAKGTGEFRAGDWCRFCKAKAVCRKRAEYNLELAKYDFEMPDTLEDAEIAAILDKVDELAAWAADVKEYALRQALSGTEYPGYKVVEGRSNRRYISEDAVADAVSQAGYDPYAKKVLGLTEMQRLLGKKKFDELLGGLIEKPQGKPVLVPMSDKRQPMNTAQNDFKD